MTQGPGMTQRKMELLKVSPRETGTLEETQLLLETTPEAEREGRNTLASPFLPPSRDQQCLPLVESS